MDKNREKTVRFPVKGSSFLISHSSSLILMNRPGGGWGCAGGTQVNFSSLY